MTASASMNRSTALLLGLASLGAAFLLPPLSPPTPLLLRPSLHSTTARSSGSLWMMVAGSSSGSVGGRAASSSSSSTTTGSAKGEVTLGPYKNGAIAVRLKRPQVTAAAAKALVAGWEKRRFKLTPVRFVEEGGTKMGHTITCDWKATYVSGGDPAEHGLRPGAVLPKADIKGFTLELKEDQPEPLASFARAVATGMGQMETKVFEVNMPESATIEAWRGVTAKIMLLVRTINIKEELAPDTRSPEEKLKAATEELTMKAEHEARQAALAAYREALLESSTADTEKMESSVSWAKFGERSLKDFKWSNIQEAIAEAEGLDFGEVPAFLFAQNPVEWYDEESE